jgi:CAAX protease family protein
MNAITSFIKRYPQATFWIIAWSTFFIGNVLGGFWFLLIYGSFLGGLFVTAIADGRSGVKTYFSRIVRWRVGIKWYAVALLTPSVLYLVGAGLNILSGAQIGSNIQWPAWNEVLIAFFWPVLLGIALAEEPGFRGFALPRLLVGRSALAAGLILGVLHAIWHIPTFFGGEAIPIICTILIIISGSIINTWLFNHTNGSVLLAMLLHAGIDIASGDVGLLKHLFTGAALERQIIFQAIAFVAFAILLPILAGRELGRKPEASIETIAMEQPLLAK